jgi:hypothetical protein
MAGNPFDVYKKGFSQALPSANPDDKSGGNLRFTEAMQTTTDAQAKSAAAAGKASPQAISLPPHLFIPEGMQSLDLRKVVNLPTASVDFELYRFQCPPGMVARFIAYGVFNDGDNGVNYEFKPLVDGSRVFPYHGDPALNYKIYLGLGPDLSNTAMIPCQLVLQPGQVLQWLLTNTSGVDASMGTRMIGYFDTSQRRTTPRFGG